MTDEIFSTLRSADEYLDNFEQLDSFFLDEGYLFFRTILDLEEVLQVKLDFMEVLEEQGIVKEGEAEPVWTGASLEQINDNALYALDSYVRLLQSKPMRLLMDKVWGEPAYTYRGSDIRYALPFDDRHMTPAHQDHFFIRQTSDFRSIWVPLMDIDERLGGLALAVGSHKHGLLEHVEQEDVYSYIFRGRKQRGVPLDRIDKTWCTTDYHPGDVLVFHSQIVHRALPNRSDRIRLSLDTRCQRETAPRIWQLDKTILEIRQYRKEVQAIATEEGANQVLVEAVIIEMMKRGLEAERQQIRAVMAELCGNLA